MKIPSDNALNFAVNCLSELTGKCKSNTQTFEVNIDEDAAPGDILRTAEADINAAFDLIADVYADPFRMDDEINSTQMEIEMSYRDEEREQTEEERRKVALLDRALECTEVAENIHEQAKERPLDVVRTVATILRDIDRMRRDVMRGLMDAAIGQIGNPNKTAFIVAMRSILNQGVVVNGFTGDAATDIDNITRKSGQAAAKTRNQLEAAAKNGRASARTKKDEAGEDAIRNTIISEVNKLKRERDNNYPDRNSGGEKGPSDNQIYQTVANKHIGDNEKPIYAATQIKEWFKPSKVKRRGGHKRK